MKDYAIIDRIEDAIVVCEKEDRSILQIPLAEFKFTPKEGDCIYFDCIWIKDANKTAQQSAKISQLVDELFE